ncbi:hypothetical protein BC834DRAFT_564725 [Gloeopeniophorella convolvens]|nr:hypothetical protein BC834DRAFT_564725 [Gloeopeniophorella convolvens]
MRHHRPPQRPSHRPPSSPFPGRPRPRVQDIFAHYPSDHPSSFPKDFIQLKDVKALGERPTPPGGPIPSRLEQPVAREHTRSPTLLVPEPTLPSRSLAEEVRERSRTTADSLPEDVLVELFDLYREEPFSRRRDNWDWHKIAHVCRKWREVVLASALRLDLQLYCTYRIPVDKMLSHSPAFPIVIEYVYGRMLPQDKDSILSALQQPHRVRKINISAHDPTMHAIVMAACDSFPLLDSLELRSSSQNTFVVPGTFLRGDAPQLRYIRLDGVALPARSPLLASTRSLVELHLERIPTEARTPVDVLLSALHRMPQLGYFSIHFLATPTRSPATGSLVHAEAPVVLPALERLRFRGDSAYLEEFLESSHSQPILSLSACNHGWNW